MAGLGPGHPRLPEGKVWIAGTSPAMTEMVGSTSQEML
jgi:hypothetical protein